MLPASTARVPYVADAPLIDPERRYLFPAELDLRFEAFVRDSLRHRQVSAATGQWYRYSYRIFSKYLAAAGISSIDAGAGEHIKEWLASARDRGVSAFTTRSYWQALRAFFVFLEREDGLLNPYRRLVPPRTPRDVLPKALSLADCVRILEGARNARWASPFERARAVAMLGVALYAGLRRNEILTLRFEDVQFAESTIRILHGKGNKQRIAYINEHLEVILLDYVAARDARRIEGVEFFVGLTHGHGVGTRTFRRIVDRVQQASGVKFGVHRLRHSFITELVRQGTQPQYVRELAGHRDLSTTERYTRLFERDKLNAVEALRFERPTDQHPSEASVPPLRTLPQRRGYSAEAS
jgi:site-specific recombinase XerD